VVQQVCADSVAVVCFWNVDPKIKLLVTKALAFTGVTLVDVSPGPSSFDEMRAAGGFARLIAYSEAEFYERLARAVLKYHGCAPPALAGKLTVIPNGVPIPARAKTRYRVAGAPRVVVNGRIAPTKFLVEIVSAMRMVRATFAGAELHVFGAAEPRHQQYAQLVRTAAGDAIDRSVFFHGAAGDAANRLPAFDAFVVLGEHQGSPNALLEALAAGLPCIANDDGGTAEQILDERTGLLLQDRAPETLARAIVRLLADRALAARLGEAGREHVRTAFSMTSMVARYEALFSTLAPARAAQESPA
jgi:glycosyltransferase involved in cell wall biosynthesis